MSSASAAAAGRAASAHGALCARAGAGWRTWRLQRDGGAGPRRLVDLQQALAARRRVPHEPALHLRLLLPRPLGAGELGARQRIDAAEAVDGLAIDENALRRAVKADATRGASAPARPTPSLLAQSRPWVMAQWP